MELKDQHVKVSTINIEIKEQNDEENKNNNDDYLEECIGAIGMWQICVSLTAVLTRYIALGNLISIVFLTPTTDFTCVEFMDNVTIIAENNTCYDSCSKYMYHSDAMMTTLISDFGLICKNKWQASFTQTFLMLGVLIGGAIFGWISDRYGRRPALISSTLLNVISMIPTSFAPNYWTFNCLRFVTGVASGGSIIVCVPLVLEIIGKDYREYAGVFIILPDGFAEAFLALYAYYLPTWDKYLLGQSVVATLIFLLICFVPESPRWLISQGKIDQAVILITGAARLNKRNTEHISETVIKSAEKINTKEAKNVTVSYLDLFKNKTLSLITISITVTWFVLGILFFGIYQYMTLRGVNIYITAAVFGLIEVPLSAVQLVLTKIFKRRISLLTSLLITGLMMIALVFIPKEHWTSFLTGLIGFTATTFCFGLLFLYQSELYPTSVRNMSFGLSSGVGRIGAMIAPFIATLSHAWAASLIFSVMSLIAAGFCFLLPETKGKQLEDTISKDIS